MDVNVLQIEDKTKTASERVISAIGDGHKWQWDENRKALLSEFARDKIDHTLAILADQFEHKWDKKSVKAMPKDLKSQLGELTKLSKEQLLFSSPANSSQPALLAIWWPWGHGATVSLRLLVLESSYLPPEPFENKDSFFTVIKKLFS